jgi:hypothetical protein
MSLEHSPPQKRLLRELRPDKMGLVRLDEGPGPMGTGGVTRREKAVPPLEI